MKGEFLGYGEIPFLPLTFNRHDVFWLLSNNKSSLAIIVFIIRNIELYPENTVKIYNRWGVIVYETSSYGSVGNYFNGRSNGRVTIQVEELLPVGTYFYVVEYVVEGETKSRAGYLYLQR